MHTDLDYSNAIGQLGEPLLELFLLVLGVGQRDLVSDLFDSLLDLRLVALTLKQTTVSMATSPSEKRNDG